MSILRVAPARGYDLRHLRSIKEACSLVSVALMIGYPMPIFGPFVHGLNKGGLNEIRTHRQLRASDAAGIAGGASAVRAHVGLFAYLQRRNRWFANPEKVFIEFTTSVAPEAHPAIAVWYMPAGAYLRIAIRATYNGAGQVL